MHHSKRVKTVSIGWSETTLTFRITYALSDSRGFNTKPPAIRNAQSHGYAIYNFCLALTEAGIQKVRNPQVINMGTLVNTQRKTPFIINLTAKCRRTSFCLSWLAPAELPLRSRRGY